VKVQLIYFVGCPHLEATREALRSALSACALTDVAVEELDADAAATPPEFRDWGSPTILIDGADIAGAERPTGLGCRIYPGGGAPGLPPRYLIEKRLKEALASAA